MSVNKTERLLNLVSVLLKARSPVPWKDISGKVVGYADEDIQQRSLERRFERDKQTLKSLGIPIVYYGPGEHSDGEGYLIPKDSYFLPTIEIAPREGVVLNLVAESVMDESVGPMDRNLAAALRKVQFDNPATLGDPGNPDRRYVPSSKLVQRGGTLNNLESLGEAIALRSAIRIEYQGVKDETPRTRAIDPYGIGSSEGKWYLVGADQTNGSAGQVKCFSVNRIVGDITPEKKDQAYNIPKEFHLKDYIGKPSWSMSSEDPEEVKLRVGPGLAWMASDIFGEGEVSEQPDGSLDVTLPVRSRPGLLRWVRRYAKHVEVLSPDSLRDELRESFDRVIAQQEEVVS